MNIITILIDSLNRHCLEPYGSRQMQTPNLARFAERATIFDNHFVGSLPCMPARREVSTGRQDFLWRRWGHLEPWDSHVGAEAASAGYLTQMVTDHYHYWEEKSHGYFEPFHGAELVRGHENDNWRTDPGPQPAAGVERVDQFRSRRAGRFAGQGSAYWANASRWRDEASYSCAQACRRAAQWLDDNHAQAPTFLWLEMFDPHEPHFVPEPYSSMYTGGMQNRGYNWWPPYQSKSDQDAFLAAASDEELRWIRAQYYGKVSMVDRWLGQIWDCLDRNELWDDTAVIVTTDHGHDLCYDRAAFPHVWGKQFPHPESHARIPLMIWHPSHPGGGRRVDALTCAVDVNATLRDITGADVGQSPHGRSLMPLVRAETPTHRDWVLYGTYGTGAVVSTAEWTLAQGAAGGVENAHYSTVGRVVSADMQAGTWIPGVEIPQWRVPETSAGHGRYLFARREENGRSEADMVPANVYRRYPAQVRAMEQTLRAAVDAVGGPPEVWRFLGLSPD